MSTDINAEGLLDFGGLIGTLAGHRIPFGNELAMQDAIEQILEQSNLRFTREFRIGTDRVDFLVEMSGLRVAVECKVKGGPSAVLQQLLGYSESDDVHAVLLVTSRNTHRFNTATLSGKPFRVLNVARAL